MNRLEIFYCGANGAGKTTLRRCNKDNVEIVIDSDQIAARLAETNQKTANLQAGRLAISLFQQAIESGQSFLWNQYFPAALSCSACKLHTPLALP